MPRQGSIKVRTGCLTCKARKVKCDEQKPECARCTLSGRPCEGYTDNREPTARFLTLARSPSTAGLNARQVDGRACQFFQMVVQPALAGPVDGYFWGSLVLQFSQYHPAVRHATIAISTLYEELHEEKGAVPTGAHELALHHYSAAIRGVVQADNEPLTLVACVLFICIEYIRGNAKLAIIHCRHGIIILNRCVSRYPWIDDYLLPIFRRLSIMPLFHGSWLYSMPSLSLPEIEIQSSACNTFTNAQHLFDLILCRAIRCIRSGDVHRTASLPPDSITTEMRTEQREIELLLCRWQRSFYYYSPTVEKSWSIRLLVQCLALQIWVNMAFEPDEGRYARHTDTFQKIIELVSPTEPPTRSQNFCRDTWTHSTKFTFEVGFTPLLYFVTIKCRQLHLRLVALSLLQKLGVSHESLWNLDAMVYMARRIIEIEHRIRLVSPSKGLQAAVLVDDTSPSHEAVPSFVYDVQWQDTEHGVHAYRADQAAQPKLLFFVRGHSSDGGLSVVGDGSMTRA